MKSCFLVRRDPVIVYVYPVAGGKWDNYAKRFVSSLAANPPGEDYRLIVSANGGRPRKQMLSIFERVKCEWETHSNVAWDISTFQECAQSIPCELMIFLGASTYFRRPGWLRRILEASDKHGLALYGAMGVRGNPAVRVWPHIRTSSFWAAPELMNAYPYRINNVKRRYEFEHGITSISEWVRSIGLKRLVVTFNGEHETPDWDKITNGYHRGDQSACMMGDRLSEPPYYPVK